MRAGFVARRAFRRPPGPWFERPSTSGAQAGEHYPGHCVELASVLIALGSLLIATLSLLHTYRRSAANARAIEREKMSVDGSSKLRWPIGASSWISYAN